MQATGVFRVYFKERLRNMLFEFIYLTGFTHRMPLIADTAGS